jgi:hypothetical protein
METWLLITRCGDSAILIPVAALIMVWLGLARNWAGLFAWCALFGGAMVLVIVTKLAFMGWGIGIEEIDFTGFSGHSSRAAAVLPVLFSLLFDKAPRSLRSKSVLVGWALALIITVSRVVVNAHSHSEAWFGFALGAVVSVTFLSLQRESRFGLARIWLLLPCVALLFALPAIKPGKAHEWITGVALYLSGREAPFSREQLHDVRHAN